MRLNRESLDSHPHAAPEKIKIGVGPNFQAYGGIAHDKLAVGGSSQNNYRMPRDTLNGGIKSTTLP